MIDQTDIEDELDLVWTADVQVLANHFFEEDAATDGSVEQVSERELRLKNRDVVAVSSRPVGTGNGWGNRVGILNWASASRIAGTRNTSSPTMSTQARMIERSGWLSR